MSLWQIVADIYSGRINCILYREDYKNLPHSAPSEKTKPMKEEEI